MRTQAQLQAGVKTCAAFAREYLNYTSHGVRAINGGAGATQNFNMLNGRSGDIAPAHAATASLRIHAHAIDEYGGVLVRGAAHKDTGIRAWAAVAGNFNPRLAREDVDD